MAPAKGLLTATALLALAGSGAAIPCDPSYYDGQLVDHFSTSTATYSQRYYENSTSFAGPGNPIFLILGGEGAVPPSTGIFYPYVTDVLATRFNALVIEPEHRFYGESLPFGEDSFATPENLALLTAPQALADAASLVTYVQQQNGCGVRGTSDYCPVVAVGGSYPGFLSMCMRLRYPALVDISYAASAPIFFYAQQVDQNAYYQLITDVAEDTVSGCADSVRASLAAVVKLGDLDAAVEALGLCTPLPAYMADDWATFLDELSMVVMYSFANLNMANYPPSENTGLYTACDAWVGAEDPLTALSAFLNGYAQAKAPRHDLSPLHAALANQRRAGAGLAGSCYNMSLQLPDGPNATISGGDWSGDGTGADGMNWDYQTSTLQVETIGTNNVTDMFLPREWTLDWLTEHASARFGVTPQPTALADAWGFDHLAEMGATNIIFTNGLKDGWSVGGVHQNLSDTLLAIDLPNGAHHSDLAHTEPSDDDTADVQAAHAQIADILADWLAKFDV